MSRKEGRVTIRSLHGSPSNIYRQVLAGTTHPTAAVSAGSHLLRLRAIIGGDSETAGSGKQTNRQRRCHVILHKICSYCKTFLPPCFRPAGLHRSLCVTGWARDGAWWRSAGSWAATLPNFCGRKARLSASPGAVVAPPPKDKSPRNKSRSFTDAPQESQRGGLAR